MTPKLRENLQVIRAAPDQFVVRDANSDAFFECGLGERQLLDLLDGTLTLPGIQSEYRQRTRRRISARNLREFVAQLDLLGLLEDASAATRTNRSPSEHRAASPLSSENGGAWTNLFFDLLAAAIGWMLHPWCLIPVLGSALLAVALLYQHFFEYVATVLRLQQRIGWGWLALATVASVQVCIGLPRSLLIGVACRRFGGRVKSFGIRWLHGLIPYFDCDPGDSLAFMESRGAWTLIMVGFWWRLFVASLATLLWLQSSPGAPREFFALLVAPG
ncbi:MAG: hypothetical protein KDA61_19965, partial [Planctomycetales bacterium]|nr:hypothetical protein [Planctomycetales bacterium]